ncbi:MAG: DUF4430 domain-containing protein [Gordonibacter sp.]|nr:DUF4430 domain-containing protein [Gordonibacter sp.]
MQDDRIVPSSISEESCDMKLEDKPLKRCYRNIAAGVVAACSVALIGVSAFFLIPTMGQIPATDMLQTTNDQASKVVSNQEAVVDTDTDSEVVYLGSEESSQPADSAAPFSRSGQVSENNAVTVSVSISSSVVGNPVSGGTTATLARGATVYDALMACGLSVNARDDVWGKYVDNIGGLAEDLKNGGGWMYSVNGVDGPVSCSRYTLNDGDVVSWRYVLSANG